MLKPSDARDTFHEDETPVHGKKSLKEQTAKTPQGRAMQDHADMVVCEAHDTMGPDSEEYLEKREHRENIADAIEYQGKLREDLCGEELENLREDLEGVILSRNPETRQMQLETINGLLAVIDDRLKVVVEAKALAEAPDQIAAYLKELDDCGKETHQAIGARDWKKVDELNRQALKAAHQVMHSLDFVRAKDPDYLISIINHMANPYKSALIQYVQSHNSFQWSADTLEHLRSESQRQAQRNRGGFYDVLLDTYHKRPPKDNPMAFLQGITHIPMDRLQKIIWSQ